jgi:hypothetical protein
VTGSPVRDLVCLVADKNIEQTLRALLATRPQSLKIRNLTFEIYVHPESDPACSRRAHDFLRPFVNSFSYALVVFDREGSGQERLTREVLEENLEALLSGSGWAERAAVVAIDPELEAWVWSRSPNVAAALGWHGKSPSLAAWLTQKGFLAEDQAKPSRPKESMEMALREVRKPRSSSIYFQLAQKVGLLGCEDPAFAKLRRCLARWFPLAPQDNV